VVFLRLGRQLTPFVGKEQVMNYKQIATHAAYAAIAGLAKMALTGSADPVSITATFVLGVVAIIFDIIDHRSGK
jgi:hypothetical protein